MLRRLMVVLLGSILVFVAVIGNEGRCQEQLDQKEGHVIEQRDLPVVDGTAPPSVTGTGTLSVFNKYIFRGYELSRKSVVVQPGLTASYEGFSAGLWGNVDSKEHATQNFVPDKPGHKSFNETDLTLSYTYVKGKVSLTGGYIYYDTDYAPETQELFATISYDVIGKPTLSIYRDIDAYPGTYLNLSLAHSIAIHNEVTLDLGASAGYMWGDGSYWKTFRRTTNEYSGPKYQALHDGMVKAGLTVPITKKVSFSPSVQYWFPLSEKATKRIDEVSSNPNGYLKSMFVWGAAINYNF